MIASELTVPFADLHAQYLTIKSEIDAAVAEVIRTSAFIRGPFVDRFEGEFAAASGIAHCVSCANGTDALYIAMHALGVPLPLWVKLLGAYGCRVELVE